MRKMWLLLIFSIALGQSPVGSVGSGCALEFDGVSNWVDVPNSPTLNFGTGDFTVSFWILINNNPGPSVGYSIIGKRPFCNAYNMWDIRAGFSGPPIMSFEADDPTVVGSLQIPIYLYEWIHIAFIRKGDSLIGYVNGNRVGSTKLPGIANVSNNANLTFSHSPCIGVDGTDYFNGQIDEVRIWNYARTQEEIRRDMCRRLTGTEPGLVGYWRFDECGGNTAFDSSGNGNDGTLY